MGLSGVQVQMLGRFAVKAGEREISDSDNRSRKVWLLLAYMICCRDRVVTQEELIDLLWKEDGNSSNPLSALKTMFHRVRTLLNQLDPSAGRLLIVTRDGNYAWNNRIPFVFDADEFDSLCRSAAAEEDDEKRLALQEQALRLYQGGFLPRFSNEPWILPLAAYFQNRYRQTLGDVLPAWERQGRSAELVELCTKAVELEPYDEPLYQYLMRALIAQNNHRAAVTVYEDMCELLFSNFGSMPSEETKAVYREAMRVLDERTFSLDMLRDLLKESTYTKGALLCDYDLFKVVYQSNARAVARSGDAIHIALLSISGKDGEALSKRSLERSMSNLQDQICLNLRRGDVVARCSVSQFVIMLPQANYENSCMVCQRIIRAFGRQYPHSPASLRFSVQPLEPNV